MNTSAMKNPRCRQLQQLNYNTNDNKMHIVFPVHWECMQIFVLFLFRWDADHMTLVLIAWS